MSLSVYSQIQANKTRTWVIMFFFTIFIATVAYVLGNASGYGSSWTGIALIFSGLISLGSYYYGDRLVLSMSGAHPADRKKDFDFWTVSDNLAIASGIPEPKVYIIEDSAPTDFAKGRDPHHAVICATRGLLDKLNRSELEGVISHELSHIQNYDTRLMAVISILVGSVAFLSDWFMRSLWWGSNARNRNDREGGRSLILVLGIIFAILSPLIATIIQLALSRRREFLADASGVLLTRNPQGLACALSKISPDREVLEAATNATAHLYIINPFKGKNFGSWFAGLFDTHPPIEERIKILRSM